MLVHRWKKPLVVRDGDLKFMIGSAEEAMTYLDHQPKRVSAKWRRALEACKAVIKKGRGVERARSAVAQAIKA